MAKLTLSGNAITVTTKITSEDFFKIKRHSPESLTIKDDKENPIFKIDFGGQGKGSINNYGIVFDSVNEDDSMYLSVIDEGGFSECTAEEKKAIIVDQYAAPLVKINQMEMFLEGVLETLTKMENEAAESIEII